MTAKISISLEHSDLALLRRRAAELYGGNLSAAVGEGVRRIREQEGRESLVRWLGAAGQPSLEQQAAIEAEWQHPPQSPKRRPRRQP